MPSVGVEEDWMQELGIAWSRISVAQIDTGSLGPLLGTLMGGVAKAL
jgi:hypothetical protein